jgi:N-acetylmuramoyl-L-alanine amidase
VLALLSFSPAAEEKRLAIYSPQTSFTVPVTDRDGREYVSITDVLDPFGQATFSVNGKRWTLHFVNNAGEKIEAEFTENNSKARIRKKTVELRFPFRTENQRGYVVLSAVQTLLSQFLGSSSYLREDSRRLFIGDTSTTYTQELQKGTASRLILHFSAPVNPSIATEPGRVRMTFVREPLVASGAQSFDDPGIRSSEFSEHNGAAEITVASLVPLVPKFSDGGRTITLTANPVPQTALPTAPGPAPAPPASTTPSATVEQTPAPAAPTAPRFMVMIDPAHGGYDPGAALGNGMFEKDITLAIARRIRADLEARGIFAVLLRDGDSTLTLEQRAIASNSSRTSVYVAIHANTLGSGVRLYSARIDESAPPPKYGFLPWNTAQAMYLNQSHNLVASLVTEFASRQITSIPLETGSRPLRNIAKPAILVEVAPLDQTEGLTSTNYQQTIATIVGSGIASLRGSLERLR